MDSPVRCTLSLRITRWRVTSAIPEGEKFVCVTGMTKINVVFIAHRPMILGLATSVTRTEPGCVYRAGIDHYAIAKQGMTRSMATLVISQPEKKSASRDGLVTTARFFVHQEMTQLVITFARVVLEPRSVCLTGMEKTVLFTADPGMILLVSTSALQMGVGCVHVTGMDPTAQFIAPQEMITRVISRVTHRQGG